MRKLIRNFLNKFGYDLVKVNQHSNDKASKTKMVMVGKFPIYMPGNNPQLSTYKYLPTANDQLARLVECVAKKYSDLCVIDIGANVGDTIAVVKSLIDVPIIAVEGDATSYKFLEKNITQFKNIFPINTFLGEKKETLHVSMDKEGWNNTIIPTETGDKTIAVKTLDEVLQEQHLTAKRLKLLKVDTEGFDTIILRGAEELIATQKPVIYFEYNRENMDAIKEDGLSTLLSLKKYNYNTIYFFDNIGRYLLSCPIEQHDILLQLHQYTNGRSSLISYYDVCIFNDEDFALGKEFIEAEKTLAYEHD
jgi:FkbM family methyltransferase